MASPTSPQPITTASTAPGGPVLVESLYETTTGKKTLIDLINNS